MNKFYSKSNLRNSGLLFSLIFFIIFFLIPYIFHEEIKAKIIIFCLIVFFLSIFSPYTLSKPYKYWIILGEKLAKINSNLILGIFFYIIITPFALIKLIFSKLKAKRIKKSYFEKPKIIEQNFEDQI